MLKQERGSQNGTPSFFALKIILNFLKIVLAFLKNRGTINPSIR
jgi:hypothetical protein